MIKARRTKARTAERTTTPTMTMNTIRRKSMTKTSGNPDFENHNKNPACKKTNQNDHNDKKEYK